MGKRKRGHNERVTLGLEPPFRQSATPRISVYRCGKCGALITEINVTQHLMKCQPLGVRCGKCKRIVPPEKFIEHFKACKIIHLNLIKKEGK